MNNKIINRFQVENPQPFDVVGLSHFGLTEADVEHLPAGFVNYALTAYNHMLTGNAKFAIAVDGDKQVAEFDVGYGTTLVYVDDNKVSTSLTASPEKAFILAATIDLVLSKSTVGEKIHEITGTKVVSEIIEPVAAMLDSIEDKVYDSQGYKPFSYDEIDDTCANVCFDGGIKRLAGASDFLDVCCASTDYHSTEATMFKWGGVSGVKVEKQKPAAPEKKLPKQPKKKFDWNLVNRGYSIEEEALINANKLRCEHLSLSEREEQIAKEIVLNKRANTMRGYYGFCLYGDAGSGKSSLCQQLADKTGMVYKVFVGDPHLTKKSALFSIEGVGEEIKKAPTELREAIINGYFLEFQEAAIVEPAVMMSLFNSIFDGTGMFTDIDGTLKPVHPDFMCAFTYNNAGHEKFQNANALDPSFKNRLPAFRLELPDTETITNRLMARTGFEDKVTVKKIANILFGEGDGSIAGFLENEAIFDTVSQRNAEDWINNFLNVYKDEKNGWVKAAVSSVIERVADGEPVDVQDHIRGLIEAVFLN